MIKLFIQMDKSILPHNTKYCNEILHGKGAYMKLLQEQKNDN